MGASFMEAVVGIERPKVGLLSVGEEQGKGTEDVLEALFGLRDTRRDPLDETPEGAVLGWRLRSIDQMARVAAAHDYNRST